MTARRVLIALALTLVAGCGDPPTGDALATVTRGDLVLTVEVTGELEAVDSTDVMPPPLPDVWEFKLAQLADEGAEVAAGEPVVGFDASTLEQELDGLRNEADAAAKKLAKRKIDAALTRQDEALRLEEAEAALRKAELKASAAADQTAAIELKLLIADRELAQMAVERARNHAASTARADAAELASLSEQVAYATGRLARVEANIAKMAIVAPRAGTVVYPTSWRGEKSKVGDSVWRMQTVMQIVSLDRMVGKGLVDEVDLAREGQVVISFIHPAQNAELVKRLAARKATVLAMDCIPRISRAQKVDALSSMANISGYRAVVEAAQKFGSFFTGQITAAGKVQPAKVLVIGAGVAGLAALGAAKGLGAIVRAFDVRAAAADQVKSMGAEFLTVTVAESGEGQGGYAKEMSKEFIDAEMALFRKQAAEVNIVITTALIPGRPAPKLWLKDMVEAMKPGSVVVDLAAEAGGNCDLTKPGEAVEHNGVTVIGYTDLPSRMANVSSELYGTNLWHLLDELGGVAKWKVDHGNDIVRGALVLDAGALTWPPPKPAAAVAAPAAKKGHGHGESEPMSAKSLAIVFGVGAVLFALVGLYAPISFLSHFTVFVLACFIGYMVIWNVKPSLHTPLMSVTNAISSIIAIGALIQIAPPLSGAGADRPNGLILGMAVLALVLTAINMFGGFAVTRRMLAMFRK